jgi:hypothetical protein
MIEQGNAQDFIRISQYHIGLIAGGFTLVGGLLGALLNHYFSTHRDRRKEFNAAASIINEKFINEQNNPSPLTNGPTETEIEVFALHLSTKDRHNFFKAIDEYNKVKNESDVSSPEGIIGILYYSDPSLIVDKIRKVMNFTKRR